MSMIRDGGRRCAQMRRVSTPAGLLLHNTPARTGFTSRAATHAVAAIIDMVDDARAQGRVTVVVATGLHRRWIEADLHQRCIAFEGDICRFLDADQTLSSLLVDGEPDRDRFRSIIGALLSDVCARNPGGVSVYGEMVGVLWSQGHTVAALRLEELWNELQSELPFSLLCGYLIDGSPDRTDLDPIRPRAHLRRLTMTRAGQLRRARTQTFACPGGRRPDHVRPVVHTRPIAQSRRQR